MVEGLEPGIMLSEEAALASPGGFIWLVPSDGGGRLEGEIVLWELINWLALYFCCQWWRAGAQQQAGGGGSPLRAD